MATSNREPQEYSSNIMLYKDPGRCIPVIFLLYSWGSLLGVPLEPFYDHCVYPSQKTPKHQKLNAFSLGLAGPWCEAHPIV